MKNKLIIMGIIVLIILTSSIAVFANTETTVTMQADKTEVKAGEIFTVIVKGTCPDGINGIATTYSYDTEKLELENATVADTNYSDSSNKAENEIFIYTTSAEKITTADLYKLTFKVKEGVAAGSIAKVSIAETLLDSDAATNSEHTIDAQEVTVTVITATDDGDEGNPPAGDGDGEQTNPPTGNGDGEQTNPPAGNGDGEQTNPPAGNGDSDGNKTEQPTIQGTTVTVGGEKDDTIAGTSIPKAGISSIIIIAIIAVTGIAFVIYKKNKSYSDIK